MTSHVRSEKHLLQGSKLLISTSITLLYWFSGHGASIMELGPVDSLSRDDTKYWAEEAIRRPLSLAYIEYEDHLKYIESVSLLKYAHFENVGCFKPLPVMH
jgi:hypothetical protein